MHKVNYYIFYIAKKFNLIPLDNSNQLLLNKFAVHLEFKLHTNSIRQLVIAHTFVGSDSLQPH